MKVLTQKNNIHIHTASGSSSASCITDCQTSIFIEVSAFYKRHALPAAALVSLAVNLPSPSGKIYSNMFCQFVAVFGFSNGVWSNIVPTSCLFLFLWLTGFPVSTHMQLSLPSSKMHRCVFEGAFCGRGREPWGRDRGVTYKRL